MRRILAIAAVIVVATDARPARAQAGMPGPLVDVGLDGVVTTSAIAQGGAWSPRITFNLSPDVAVMLRGFRVEDERIASDRTQATLIEADVRRQLAHAGPLAVQALAGAGLRFRRDFRVGYERDPATGQYRPVPVRLDRRRLAGVFGAGLIQRAGSALEIRQDLRFAIETDGIEMSVSAGVTVPLGRYTTRRRGQSVPLGDYRLRTGQRVWVTEDDGRTIDGHVGDISASSIEIIRPSGRAVVDMARVRRMTVPDSLRNGVRNGALIGGLGLGAYSVIVATAICECHDETAVLVAATLAGFGTGGGALIGAIVDSFRVGQRTILERPAAATITIAPILTPTRRAAAVAVRW